MSPSETWEEDLPAIIQEQQERITRLQAVVNAVENVPWMLKHAAGAYIDLDRPDLHAKCMDKADEILRALSEVKP